MKKITAIAANVELARGSNRPSKKKKVCAYCRVSTNNLKQEESLEAQSGYYKRYIKENYEWEFSGIYADKGISGTSVVNRAGFNKMIEDCEMGNIDLIITKSISRFARNTADCLEQVRNLKNLNIGVYFERENINSQSDESELVLSILSSLAQEESRNISENIRWAIQRNFREGKIQINDKRFLGYEKNEKGELMINENEAKLIKRIYREYLNGKSLNEIKKGLEYDGIKTVTGKDEWNINSIRRILKNEKYMGTLILQKTYTVDFIDKKRKENKGEVPKYVIENNHDPIISKEDYLKVQVIMKDRGTKFGNVPAKRDKYTNRYEFSGKIICGNCGAVFKRRTWNSNSKNKQIVWQCGTYVNKGKAKCSMKSIDDMTLKALFVRMFNRIYEKNDDIFETFMFNIKKVLMENEKLGKDFTLQNELESIKHAIKTLIRRNIQNEIGEKEFEEKYKKLNRKLEECKKLEELRVLDKNKYDEILEKTNDIKKYIKNKENILLEFDRDVFKNLIEKIVIISSNSLEFHFNNGMKIEEKFIKKRGKNGLQ